MSTAWNNGNDWFNYNPGNGDSSFEKHAECMRAFYKSHVSIPLVNSPRHAQPSLLEGTRPLYLADIGREIGGSSRYFDVEDWSTLIPIWKVAQHKLSQS